MKLAMAQLSMSEDLDANFEKTLKFIDSAAGSDLLLFPEVQLTPFFPQYEKRNADAYVVELNHPKIEEICRRGARHGLYLSPNVYLQLGRRRFDASLWITPEGKVEGIAKMVHVMQAKNFCEADYYTPSDDGFHAFPTPWGKIGIVICFDRHLPESIRTCALLGADLMIIPTANTLGEPMEMFEWELRVQAMQNNVFIAMCNRVGREGNLDFCGQSIVVDPNGEVLFKADDREQLVTVDLDLSRAKEARKTRPYITTRRPEFYR